MDNIKDIITYIAHNKITIWSCTEDDYGGGIAIFSNQIISIEFDFCTNK